MTKLTTEIKRMLNALTSADAGKYLASIQKVRYLNQGAGAAAPAAAKQVRPASPCQQVAPYMGSELPADVMNYVVQNSARLKHGLTALTFQSESALLSLHADALADGGIDLQKEALSGDPVPELARYLRRHSEVAFLVRNETGYPGRGLLNGSQRRGVLPVPVVLVLNR